MHHKLRLRDDPRIDSVIFFEESLVMAAHLKQTGKAGERCDAFKLVKSLQELKTNFSPEEVLIFNVFDRVKVLVDTTTEFPLDIKCTLLFSKEDMESYEKIRG